jgi:uncharacterized protein
MIVAMAGPTLGAAPSFDCARAEGEVEQLICTDPALGTLDVQLAETYRAALASPDGPATLRAEQRDWIKGRNDCWKSDDVRQCVADAYATRIAELQVSRALVPAIGPMTFACDDGSKIVATFYQSDPPGARLVRGDQQLMLLQGPSGSGARYLGDGVLFWNKGRDATVDWQGKSFGCTEAG